LLEEYLASADEVEAASCLEDLRSSSSHSKVIHQAIMLAIEKKERDRAELIKLLAHLLSVGLLKPDDFAAGFTSALDVIEEIDIDIPYASKYLAVFMGNIIALDNSLPLSFFGDGALDNLIESGKAAQIVCGVLNTIKDIRGISTVNMYKKSNLDILKFLRKSERSVEYARGFLKDKGLLFVLDGESAFVSNSNNNNNQLEEPDKELSDVDGGEEHSQFPLLQDIVVLQTAEGFWHLNKKLSDIFGIPLDEVSETTPPSLRESKGNQVWATLLALEFLTFHFKNDSSLWEMLSKKAHNWVDKELKALKVDVPKAELQKKAFNLLSASS